MRRALSLLLLTAGWLVITPPANAAGMSVAISSGVLWSDCREVSYTYSVDVPPGTRGWSADMIVRGPDGIEVGSDYVYNDANLSSGTSSFQVCGGELPGAWTISGTLDYYDQDYDSAVASIPGATFSMRLPFTRTTLKVSDSSPAYNQKVTFKVKSKDERVSGYFANEYAEVRLQVRKDGRWVNVKKSKTTTDRGGVAKLSYRWNIRSTHKFRAVTVGTRDFSGSTSAPRKVT